MPLKFEWDTSKAVVNLKKHGVGFDEACTVFDDPLAAIFRDVNAALRAILSAVPSGSAPSRR
jgi:uncharacterized DUF497 family protein